MAANGSEVWACKADAAKDDDDDEATFGEGGLAVFLEAVNLR